MIRAKTLFNIWSLVCAAILIFLLKACNSTPPSVASLQPNQELISPNTSFQVADPLKQGYQIDLKFETPIPLSQRLAFEQAANRWEQVIVADLPNVFSIQEGEFVDDLLINVRIRRIDGSNGILGLAGPTTLRIGSGLPAAGVMEFDRADLETLESIGQLELVILHEMLHVIGFGTIWDRRNFNLTNGILFPRYTGRQGASSYRDVFNLDFFAGRTVPLEPFGGAGTRGSHWSEGVFGNELMTGFLNGGSNPISSVTIASLADLGYQVDARQAELFNPTVQRQSQPLGHCQVLNDLPIEWVEEISANF
jgi:hypothetical protein